MSFYRLMMRPCVVLADEPTAHLDAETRAGVMHALQSAVQSDGAALVLVTHDVQHDAFADRVLLMEDGRFAAAGDAG